VIPGFSCSRAKSRIADQKDYAARRDEQASCWMTEGRSPDCLLYKHGDHTAGGEYRDELPAEHEIDSESFDRGMHKYQIRQVKEWVIAIGQSAVASEHSARSQELMLIVIQGPLDPARDNEIRRAARTSNIAPTHTARGQRMEAAFCGTSPFTQDAAVFA
jgi:hypothetical protein